MRMTKGRELSPSEQWEHFKMHYDRLELPTGQIALLGCHADRNDNPQIKAVWEGIAKKFNGLGISGFSMVCARFTVAFSSPLELLHQCALCILCSIAYSQKKATYSLSLIHKSPSL
ncbi:hypothetical protein M5236_004947 [Vibrio parahaemolyticus]|nr:hypothetical protein [Vibrio parahaemolyticus]